MKDLKVNISPINGVVIDNLRVIPDERGAIYHGGKQSDLKFEEVYFKKLFRDVINGWHVHQSMTLNYVCIFGHLKLVLCDLRAGSETYGNVMEVYAGEHNHCRVTIPTGIANASQCINGDFCIFANLASHEHDPSLKYERIDPLNGFIKYEWNDKNW